MKENAQRGECENVTNLLKRRDPPPKNPDGESVLKKQEGPALETQKLQKAAATEPTQQPFRNPFHVEAIAVASDFGNVEDVEQPTGHAEPPKNTGGESSDYQLLGFVYAGNLLTFVARRFVS